METAKKEAKALSLPATVLESKEKAIEFSIKIKADVDKVQKETEEDVKKITEDEK